MNVSFLGGLAGGCISFGLALYGYMSMKGIKLLPAELEEKITRLNKTNQTLVCDQMVLEAQISNALKNLTLAEAGAIFQRAKELKTGGYTETEVYELGKMIMDSIKD